MDLPDSKRLFIAFDLPADLLAAIEAWQSVALDRQAWRPVRADALHLTLVFLGSRPADEIEEIVPVIAKLLPARPANLELSPTPVGIPRRRPRALAFEARAPEVSAFATALAGGLEDAGLHDRESRPYWPHLTVARRRRQKHPESGAERGRRRAEIPSEPLAASLCRAIGLDRVVLYRSKTAAGGARHTPEAEFTLGVDGA